MKKLTFAFPKTYKNKEVVIYIKAHDFYNDFNFVFNKLNSVTITNQRYSVITRVCYSKNFNSAEAVNLLYTVKMTDQSDEWKTLGDQINITKNDEFYENITNYVIIMKQRLDSCTEIYNFHNYTIQGIQIIIHNIYYTTDVTPKKDINLNSLGDNKDLINVSLISKYYKSLPLTMNYNDFGCILNKEIMDGYVSTVKYQNGKSVNFVELVNKFSNDKHKLKPLYQDTLFYQSFDNERIIVIEKFNNSYNIKNYSVFGMLINEFTDTKLDEYTFTRKFSNVLNYINYKGVYKKEIQIKLSEIKPSVISGYWAMLVHSDNRIGTLDLETYINKYNIPKTYAIGYYVYEDIKIFYIDSDLDSDKLIIKCLESMLCKKFNGFTFYVHNLGKYDSIFLLKVIEYMCCNDDKYKYKTFLRDQTIISITISKKVGKNYYNIKLVDSYNFLSSSLRKLAISFGSDVKKGYFPYSFVKQDTLFYQGDKPNKNFYDIDKNSFSEFIAWYDNTKIDSWSTRQQTLEYLESDLISLYNVMDSFKMGIYSKHYIHITRSLTISGLSMDIFLRRFNKSNIPLINKRSIYNDIKLSYFGGVTEVYKPQGKNLYYYDVNSLYPYSALNPMPGLNCIYIDNINLNIRDCYDDLFGFYYCKITACNGYLGLLPYRAKNGLLIMPTGKFEGWYFSEELKYVFKNGYQIDIIKGYKFDKSYNVFDEYVNKIYDLKCNTKDPVERNIAKSLLNNLLGRFGMDIDKDITEIVDIDKYNTILQTRIVKGEKYIGNKILVTYSSEISRAKCEENNVDYNNIVNSKLSVNKTNTDKLSDVSIPISSAVTSYSRIYMNKIKMDILKKGGLLYYTDTDSIVTDVMLDNKYVGSEIGKFKLEDKILEGYFISNKTYCIKTANNNVKMKAKGFFNESLNPEYYEKLYQGIDIKSKKRVSKKDYTTGYVEIIDKDDTLLSPSCYNKRIKVYNNGIWTDTKPLILD